MPPWRAHLMTNSAKYAHYAPGPGRPPGALRQPRRLRRGRAVGGRAPAGRSAWLSEDR
ncbi:hypothetical protein ACPA9J_14135 [Pseudomonas aeruginosa]